MEPSSAVQFSPLPYSAEVLHDFLNNCSLAKNSDGFLASLSTFSQLHNPEASAALLLDGCALKDALRRHPTFFAPDGLLARILALAAPLHAHFPQGLPLLCAAPAALALPRAAVASLLACMFLCALPRPRADCNTSCTAALLSQHTDTAPQKLLCLLHYLERVAAAPPQGVLALRRLSAPLPLVAGGSQGVHAFLAGCQLPLLPLQVLAGAESIHDAHGLQADFANRYLGGGALSGGCVQEEIMFMVAPECLAAQLLAPVLQDHEAFLIAGAERFSRHTGYGATFEFAGTLEDPCGRVPAGGPPYGFLLPGSAATALVAFDALPFPRYQPQALQLRPEHLLREVLKAAAAFGVGEEAAWPAELGRDALPIATGHWGCGAFNGHKLIKAAVQWMTASAAGRTLQYHCFSDAAVAEQLGKAQEALGGRVTVAQLYAALLEYKWCEDGATLLLDICTVAGEKAAAAAATSGTGQGGAN